jgi:hypothetical protein
MIHPYGKKARKTKRPLPESGKLLKYRRFFFETDDFKSDIMIMAEFGQNKIERNKFNIR